MAILNHLALILVLSCIFKHNAAKPDKKLVKKLFNAMVELEFEKNEVDMLMYTARKSAGYGPFKNKPCRLVTSPIYKFVTLKENTLVGHLMRIQMILDPFISASEGTSWARNIGSSKLQKKLTDVKYYIITARFRLFKLDSSVNFPPAVTYNSTALTHDVRLYLNCAGIPVTPAAVRFLRYATFVKALRFAMNNMSSDIRYLKNYK